MITKKLNINELRHKSEWSEVIKLYSGLFDTKEERENYIIDLSQIDTLLAADCELSSILSNPNTSESIKEIAVSKYSNGKLKPDVLAEAIVILKLGDEKYFIDFLDKNFAKGNTRVLFQTGLNHLSQESIFNLLSKLIRNRRKIYSKWIITFLLSLEKYSVSINQADEAIKSLTLIKKRTSYKLALKLIYQYDLVEIYSKDYLLNLLTKKGSKDSFRIAKWLENVY
ncbi:MAG: hypothetical protein K9I70_03890 [Chitinophagaceae bacterium]|nr:hypothetical protein [Chitinophagaceae bacterium]